MLTVTNRLDTCLVIPEGQRKGALFLEPKGKAKVEKITATLKEAEKNGQVTIRYPAGAKADPQSENARSKKGKTEGDAC